jgi:hypothetical protein
MSGQQHPPVPETAPRPESGAPETRPVRQSHPATEPVSMAHPEAARESVPATTPVPEPSPGWGGAGWGAPPSAGIAGAAASGGKPWTLKRGLVVAGAATVLAAGAGVGVYSLGSNAAAANGTAGAGGLGQGGLPQGGVPQGGTVPDGTVPGGTVPDGGGALGGRGGLQGGFDGGAVPGQGGAGDFAPDGLGGMGSGVSSAVHSEYVVQESGQYVTKVAQLGAVSSVASDSVTVKSADGFTRTYTLDDATVVSNQQQRRQQTGTGGLTVADIVSGAAVRIVAAKEGSKLTAESVLVTAATQAGQNS